MPPRVDTRLLFPGDRGGYLGLHAWRRDEWTPAVFAAGLAHRSPYAHQRALCDRRWRVAVRARPVHEDEREQIDRTYGHLLPDSIDRTRTALNSFLAAQTAAQKEASRATTFAYLARTHRAAP